MDRLRLKMSFSSSTEVNSNCTILYESRILLYKRVSGLYERISFFFCPPRLQIGRMELFAKLENSDKRVRIGALRELAQRQLEPATLAQRANAVVAMLEDSEESVREAALVTLRQLGPKTLAQHADAVFARLEDYESVRVCAFWTLCKLEPAALAQYADGRCGSREARELLYSMSHGLYLYILNRSYIILNLLGRSNPIAI